MALKSCPQDCVLALLNTPSLVPSSCCPEKEHSDAPFVPPGITSPFPFTSPAKAALAPRIRAALTTKLRRVFFAGLLIMLYPLFGIVLNRLAKHRPKTGFSKLRREFADVKPTPNPIYVSRLLYCQSWTCKYNRNEIRNERERQFTTCAPSAASAEVREFQRPLLADSCRPSARIVSDY